MGHIRQRGRGWIYVVELPRRADGKRDQLTSRQYRTKSECKAAMVEKEREIRDGLRVRDGAMLLRDFMPLWLGQRQGLRASTREQYQHVIDRHIVPGLGHLPLQGVTPLSISTWQRDIEQRIPTTAVTAHVLLHGALEQAWKWNLIRENPVRKVEAIAPPRVELDVWDQAEARQFLAWVERERPADAALYRLALETGLRRGELLGLRWNDVDLDEGTLFVQWTVTRAENRWLLGPPKTARSRRRVTLTPAAVAALKRQRALNAEKRLRAPYWDDQGLIVPNSRGGIRSPTSVSIQARELMRRAGVREIRFHDLRHTAATLMILGGVDVKTVSETLGHSSVAFTLDRYARVLESMRERVRSAMDRLLG